MTKRFAAIVTALAISAAAALPATAKSGVELLDPAVLKAARAEGSVTVYGAQSQDLLQATAAAFEAAVPGIKVNILRAASGTLANRFMSEAEAGVFEADVLNSANVLIFTNRPAMWRPLTVETIPTVAAWPSDQLHNIYLNSSQGPQLIAYNSNLIAKDKAPKTWEDLLDPKYKGKGMIVDPRASNTYLNWVNLMYETYGATYVEKLRAQNFVPVEGGTQGVQQVAAGAYLVVIPPSFAHVQPLLDQGAPLGYVYPSENSSVPPLGPQHSWGLPAKSPHPNAGRVFMTWLLTPEAQRINCGGNSASVLLTDYEGCPSPVKGFISADQPIAADRKAKLLALLGLQ
ncbi:MAG TPA: extracellular solute-binding protein [Xanthobacteraceae bacterium]|nr:extracellular solute-binding protein [Xanthobacteraceae bacterium]